MLMKFLYMSGLIAALALTIPPAAARSERPQALSERGARAAGASRVEVIEAVAVPANGPIVLDGRFNEEIWQQAPAIVDFQQREPAEGQPPTHAHRSAHGLRRRGVVCGGARLRHRSRQARRHPHPPRSALPLRLDPHRRRFVLRQAIGVRVWRQSGRRQDRPLLLQRRPERRQLGRGVGRRRSSATATAGARSSRFLSRSCVSTRSPAARWASR